MLVKYFHISILILNSHLFCQQVTEPVHIYNSDFNFFRQKPEIVLFAHLPLFNWKDQQGSTIDISFIKLEQLITHPDFVVDTIYFHYSSRLEKFKCYRRIFTYNEHFRIESIIAEELLNDEWTMHQLTKISYNDHGQVLQINHSRLDGKFDSLIIYYEYNEQSLLLKEFCEGKGKTEHQWSTIWIKKYFYDASDLIFYKLIDHKNYHRGDPKQVKFKYDDNDQLVESIRYKSIDTLLVEEYKWIWEYDVKKRLSVFNSYKCVDSLWYLSSSYDFEYDSLNNLIRMVSIDPGEDTIKFEKKYFYNYSGNLDSISINGFIGKNADSLITTSHTKVKYDENGLTSGYRLLSKYKDRKVYGRAILNKRDEFGNIILIRNEILAKKKWVEENRMRIIYRSK